MQNRIRVLLNIFNIIVLSLVFILTVKTESPLPSFSLISPYLSLGFLIIVAYLAGSIAKSFSLPSITGNLAA